MLFAYHLDMDYEVLFITKGKLSKSSCVSMIDPINGKAVYTIKISRSSSTFKLSRFVIFLFNIVILIRSVIFQEFVDYYTALSLSEEDDQVFVTFMRHCWNV